MTSQDLTNTSISQFDIGKHANDKPQIKDVHAIQHAELNKSTQMLNGIMINAYKSLQGELGIKGKKFCELSTRSEEDDARIAKEINKWNSKLAKRANINNAAASTIKEGLKENHKVIQLEAKKLEDAEDSKRCLQVTNEVHAEAERRLAEYTNSLATVKKPFEWEFWSWP